ncbi:MAG: radical SAM protein [Oscillospiraceae bacterium]|nr:radical SAM protein [Oscillospiraceae bacterium]
MEFQLTNCRLCPRRCGTDRTKSNGVCGGGNGIKAARAALHFGEEPCISGNCGSGTVFFSGCQLHCCFCQNDPISRHNEGKIITPQRLAEIFLELQQQNAHNINLVTADHLLPWILEALDLAKPQLHIPVVYNCSGYELPEAIAMLDGYVDIFLPDFKFFDTETARNYANAPDYPAVAERAIAQMLAITGKPVFEGNILKRGCIIRHLVLPGHRHESIALLHHLKNTFGTDNCLLSLMSQYTPMRQIPQHPQLNRRITKMEYNCVLKTAQDLGFQGYLQDKSSANSIYTPEFDNTGI